MENKIISQQASPIENGGSWNSSSQSGTHLLKRGVLFCYTVYMIKTNQMNLSKDDLRVINEVFCIAYSFDHPEKWDADFEDDPEMNENFTSERFSQVWDVISANI